MCKEDKQLTTYFGYDNDKSLKIQDNHKTRDVKNLLLNHSNIKRIQDNPITLKWFDNNPTTEEEEQQGQQQQSDEPDESDKEKDPNQEKNNEKNNKNFNGSGLEPTSDSSDSSFSNEEEQQEEQETTKGFQMSPKGRVYQVSEEQFKNLNGNGKGDDDY